MELTYEKKKVCDVCDEKTIFAAQEYSEGYKQFLDCAKTERETVAETVRLLEKSGYKPWDLDEKISRGDKVYFNNRGKSLYILRAGTADVKKNGIKIIVAHADCPRLDLKPEPLFEDAFTNTAYLKTHYYGGIKKYQWLTIPLSLHGVIVKKSGEVVNVNIGEKDGDPVFYITDILPHLSHDRDELPLSKAFSAESFNLIAGGTPAKNREKEAVKYNVLKTLNALYGVSEEDFLSAELEAVPSGRAKDVGFDRAFICSYGQDDRVCVYPAITATVDAAGEDTVLTVLVDKEEIGSDGASGIKSRVFSDVIDKIAESFGASAASILKNSKGISADVTPAFDPFYSELFDTENTAVSGCGVAINKYNGAKGKSGTNDASAEYMAYLRRIFEKEGVVFQSGEIAKVDVGGFGTVSKFLAEMNVDVADVGVPLYSMHAPNELSAKTDVYETYKAFMAFIKG